MPPASPGHSGTLIARVDAPTETFQSLSGRSWPGSISVNQAEDASHGLLWILEIIEFIETVRNFLTCFLQYIAITTLRHTL